MFKKLKQLLRLVPSEEEHYKLKETGLVRLLGPMHENVLHAIIPFQIGGAVDMYLFPKGIPGAGIATMELIDVDGSGPKKNRLGTYELVAFTRIPLSVQDEKLHDDTPFGKMLMQIWKILTGIARYSYMASLNPNETCEMPNDDGTSTCLIFDEYRPNGRPFMIGNKKHGLLLVMQIHRQEMEYAMKHSGRQLIVILKEQGHWPYSDLDRESVI